MPEKREISELLLIRSRIKSRTPKFQRQESWRYVRIHDPWRKPKGVDSHMRLSVKGWPVLVKVGYRVPEAVRGLHPSGLRDVVVKSASELENLDPRKDAARLARTLGRKKKIELAKKARDLGIRVLNGRGLLGAQKVKEEEAEEKEESTKKNEKRGRKSKE